MTPERNASGRNRQASVPNLRRVGGGSCGSAGAAKRMDTIFDMRYSTVLFDLDGTLIDSGAMILASFRHATRSVLQRDFSDAELLAAVGGTTLHEQMRTFDADRTDELVESYREHNSPLHAELQPCPGVLDLLDRLADERRRLGVVTSKRRATVNMAFDVLPLEHYFGVVVTTEQTERHKPHPQPLLFACDRLGVEPSGAVYVGDAPFDVAAAKAAGLGAVAVAWGGIHSRECLEAERPDAIADTPDELYDLL
jgi:pyrophosphatase PpaX